VLTFRGQHKNNNDLPLRISTALYVLHPLTGTKSWSLDRSASKQTHPLLYLQHSYPSTVPIYNFNHQFPYFNSWPVAIFLSQYISPLICPVLPAIIIVSTISHYQRVPIHNAYVTRTLSQKIYIPMYWVFILATLPEFSLSFNFHAPKRKQAWRSQLSVA